MVEISETVPAGIRAPRQDREALSPLAEAIPPRDLADLAIVVSELVTNSVRHSGLYPGEPIELYVRAEPKRLRVQVSDSSSGFEPATASHDPLMESGWGLRLVEGLMDRWGVLPGDGVWAEKDIPAGAHSA